MRSSQNHAEKLKFREKEIIQLTANRHNRLIFVPSDFFDTGTNILILALIANFIRCRK